MIIKDPVPISSFLSIEKDLNIIINKCLNNKRLKRLLYYTTPNALSQPDLNDEQAIALLGKNIRITPKLFIDNETLNYLFINFDNFAQNDTNPEYRNNIIEFDILCHVDQWNLKDFQMRPYRIAAEIDSMFNKQKLSGIGTLTFIGADNININDEFFGVCLTYVAIHGDEDKKPMLNPYDQKQFEKDFYEMMALND